MMNIIDCTTQPEHRVIYGICTTPIPDGWAVIPDGMTLPGVLAYADITTEERDGLPTVTAITPRPDLVAQAEAAAAAAQEEASKKQEAQEKLPETVAALQEDNKTLKKENEMLKQCLLEMSEIVYA